jgi:UDP-3-O-acyl N-acetylglucosamine deacetylase
VVERNLEEHRQELEKDGDGGPDCVVLTSCIRAPPSATESRHTDSDTARSRVLLETLVAKSAEQTTLARPVTKHGVGLHTGASVSVRLTPAVSDTGVTFVLRSGIEVPATAEFVVDTERATTLGAGGASIGAVEHLMAAVWIAGIDNVRIEADGPEAPACDGSATEWITLLRQAGRRRLGTPRAVRSLRAPVWQGGGESWAVVLPAKAGLSVAVAVDFAGTVAGRQTLWAPSVARRFAGELAPARTFAFEHEVAALRASGLARGGGVENAFTVGRGGYSGPLRFPDEVVRHKALDLIGDLALCGCALRARVIAVRPGHRGNVELARGVRAALVARA